MKRILTALGISALVLAPGGAIVAAPGASLAAPVTPIRHVVVLDLENHTFDNVFGYWCKSHFRRCPAGGMPATVTLSNGTVVTPGIAPDTVPDVDHSVRGQRAAINGGKMNGWQNLLWGCGASTRYACISGYRPSHIPNETALAQRFAISDRTFSMYNSPSWGGHLYVAISSQDGFSGENPIPPGSPAPAPGPGWGCDSNKVTMWTDPQGKNHWGIPSCVPDPALGLPNGGAFKPTPVKYVPTIFDRLDAARLSWKIYGALKPPTPVPALGYQWSICPSLAECLYTSQHNNLVPSSQFVPAAQAGNLPAYSVVVPGTGTIPDSQHNDTSMTVGDNWIGQVAGAVMNGPEWSSTALFITYDDCGCFYDHVRPGMNPDGTPQGPRMPLVIVSPYARVSYTDTTPTTFAGMLAFAEHTFGLAPLNANDRGAYDFSNAFNFAQAPLRPVHMVVSPLPPSARHIHLTPAMLNDPT